MQFPRHAASLHLTHNQHKAYYDKIEDYANSEWVADDWVSEEQKAKAILEDSVWELQWYPNTPVGFCKLFACDLDVLLEAALREED